MTLAKLITSFVRQHWNAYLLAAVMLASISVLTITVPRRVGRIVDGLVTHQLDGARLLEHLAWLLAIGIAIYFLRVGWRLQLFRAAYRFGVSLRCRLYAQLSQQGLGFYQGERTGNLMALATNDIDAIEMAAGEAMLAGFDGTLTLILVVASMTFGVDWRLAAVALLPFPLMAFAFWRISQRVHVTSARALTRFSAINDHVQESLTGVRALRALGAGPHEARRFAALVAEAATADLKAQRWEAAYEPAVGLTLSAAVTLTLALGGYLVWHDALTIGALTSFSMYLGQLIWPMFAAGWVLSLVERARAAWGRLEPVLHAPASMPDEGVITDPPTGALRLADVTFSYPGQDRPALSEISLDIVPGMTLGLVGPTGSGKSTLLRLLLRQYAPTNGTLSWGGNLLADYRLSVLHAATSWVPQEAFLFSATIADNIALARPEAPRSLIEAVARIAAIHDDIRRWPQGYETPVGERGMTLSGGQRQRVALARALIADCDLLLLDDALSAVDTLTESRILGHLRAARTDDAGKADETDSPGQPVAPIAGRAGRQRRTTVIASHRLSAVADADRILVLRAGHVVASGTHAELLAQDGWYAAQWRYQQLEASLDAL